MSNSKTVGRFTYDSADGSIQGPKAYIGERFDAVMNGIYAGRSTVFNFATAQGSEPAAAILVALQTDYAGWKGTRDLVNRCSR